MSKIQQDILAGWKVLLLDDEPDNLEIAEALLEQYGATVYSVANGAEGLDILESITPDFIISDLSMPVMDGWDFIAHLQISRKWEHIPVIALTAHSIAGNRTKAMAAGFHNYMTKPLTVDTFVRDLVRILVDVPEFDRTLHLSAV